MNKKIIYLVIAILIFVFSLFFYIQNKQVEQKQMLGGDRDEYGCIGSAGYSWCPLKQKCLRVWEEPCEENTNLDNTNGADISPNKIVINGDANICKENGGEWFETTKTCEINSLDQNMCTTKGGEWNECNSACRHDPKAEMCTMQCVLTCCFR